MPLQFLTDYGNPVDRFINYIGTVGDPRRSGGVEIEGYEEAEDGGLYVIKENLSNGARWREPATNEDLIRVPFGTQTSLEGVRARREEKKTRDLRQQYMNMKIGEIEDKKNYRDRKLGADTQIGLGNVQANLTSAGAQELSARTADKRLISEDRRYFTGELPLKEQEMVLRGLQAKAQIDATKDDIALKRAALQSADRKWQAELDQERERKQLELGLLLHAHATDRHNRMWGPQGHVANIAAGIGALFTRF